MKLIAFGELAKGNRFTLRLEHNGKTADTGLVKICQSLAKTDAGDYVPMLACDMVYAKGT